MKKGFGLIELMIGIALASIVLIGVYRFWIKSSASISKEAKLSALKTKAQLVFNSVQGDLQLIGYNPNDIDVNGMSPYNLLARPSGLSSLAFRYFNDNYPNCTAGDECKMVFQVDDTGMFTKNFYDVDEPLILVRNACALFLYCDSALEGDSSTSGCYCSGDSAVNCSDQTVSKIKTIKFVLSLVPKERFVSGFDSQCKNTMLEPGEYVRIEKRVYLTNLH